MFPQSRARRLRARPNIRDLVRETELSVHDLVYPIFVNENLSSPREIGSMPGVLSLPISRAGEEARCAENLGIPAVLLFGVPSKKDPRGTPADDPDGVVQRAIREMKRASDITIITDLCLCEYTDHGHCGIINKDDVDNDATLQRYAEVAVSQARAGADMIAPSGMMDGQVAAIRDGLDQAGFESIPIMSYAAKYASSFYGPFRDAAESTPQHGDRRSHQMDPGNAREAFREMSLDLEEGADILMVKPALPYLDIVRRARDKFNVPIAAYQVSGEYSMIKAAAANGWIDHDGAMMESLRSIKRAGAEIIITYFAKEAARMVSS
ncbi:MAG: porphobilinogen synthase [Methanomassiliicoccus sp.]|nr:porphobilinogen synthase [Methanomassiliicoccus sp.]